MNKKKILLASIFTLLFSGLSFAQSYTEVENVYKYRVGAELEYKIIKGLKLSVEPEFRFFEGYDQMQINSALSYKTFGCITWGASYGVVIDREESSSSSYSSFGFNPMGSQYESDIYYRYAFDVSYKDDFGRFTPSLRVRYSNYDDEDIDDKEFMRYRAKVSYNIPKCKFTPSLSAEWYQQMDDMMLFKTRYAAGLDYKISKQVSLGADYKLDFYNLKYKNGHIFTFCYKYKF